MLAFAKLFCFLNFIKLFDFLDISARNAVSIDDSERRDRIAKEQSLEREQSRDRIEKGFRREPKGFEIER